ncbi:MAG: PAS domain-containing sensor histidine kinase [Rhodospirillaceae bacterium]|nr:PAS domain-containing sensor histidine kinase [Rhodospirillaceae bacterium]
MNAEPTMTADNAKPWFMRRLVMRFAVWARRVRLVDRLSIAVAVAALISGAATYAALTGWGFDEPSSTLVLILLNVDTFLLLTLIILVGRRLLRLWVARKSGAAGSRLYVRLALLFGVIAVVPAVVMAVFSALFFTLGVQSWFGERVETAISESAAVARAYLSEHQQVIRGDALAVANDINRQWLQLSSNPALLNNYLSTQAAFRGLTEAVIFTSDWQVIAKTGYTFALQSGEQIPFPAIAQANLGEVALVTGENSDRVRALVKLEVYGGAYLYVGRFIDAKVLGHVTRTTAAADEYAKLELRRADIEVSFTLLFSLVALLLAVVAIWFGLNLASRMAQPIAALIDASERVGQGNLGVRVREIAANDEVATLSRAFNRMTRRLEEQQTDLLKANQQLDDRRRFTETVLGGVSSGVVGLDPRGCITLPNRAASLILGTELAGKIGHSIADLVPEFAALLNDIGIARSRSIQREVQIVRAGRSQVFLVRLAVEQAGETVQGYVLTFDDITELQSAQRKAAWADVARRIAHEIKNPLTPIQLSAERLRRKYLDRMTGDDGALFTQCTDTIIRHVGDIGHMVDEFSAFARMPSPVMAVTDLRKVVLDAVMLQRNAYPKIAFSSAIPQDSVMAKCDARLLGQALTNVLKNAVEAIEARLAQSAGSGSGEIHVGLTQESDACLLRITDNGVGLPKDERHRLTEPYVTTRTKGTGLGLAIVKKIIEDHGGTVSLDDAPGIGAVVTLSLNAAKISEHVTQPEETVKAPLRAKA